MKYKVLVTEMHTAEYHVEADSRDKAVREVLTGVNEPVSSCYNETLKDPNDMYVVEMKDEQSYDYRDVDDIPPEGCDYGIGG